MGAGAGFLNWQAGRPQDVHAAFELASLVHLFDSVRRMFVQRSLFHKVFMHQPDVDINCQQLP